MSATLAGKGWWNPEPMRSQSRYHYVGDDNRSLCGKWHYLRGKLEQEDNPSPDDCRACRKKVDTLKAALAAAVGRAGTEDRGG